ncbi:hypothetical protein ACHAWF_008849, partial [Thalassiosira exigua]
QRAAIERARVEFNHADERRHEAELYLGAANVLYLVLSMSEQEDKRRAGGLVHLLPGRGACARPDPASAPGAVREGTEAVPHGQGDRRARPGDIAAHVAHLRAVGPPRVPPRAGVPLGTENRVLRMRLLANLANSEGNKVAIFERASLMEATMKVATLDKADGAREYASAVLMDLSGCPANQMAMAGMDKVLATLVKLAVTEDRTETREYAVSGLQNLAFEKRNRVQLASYGGGVVVEALKKCTESDVNDKTRRRAAGALTNLAYDETAERMADHPGLLRALARASSSDGNADVRQRATLALTKLANSITVRMPCWGALLDALVEASRCTAADGIVSAMFRVKTRLEENRAGMASHPRLLETLARLCLGSSEDHPSKGSGSRRTRTARTRPRPSPTCSEDHLDERERIAARKDCENATKAIAHLANEPSNHRAICNKHVLAALVHGASLAGPEGTVTRDAAILAMERMAMEHTNRPMMARYPGMLVSIAKATEREMHEEMNGIPAGSVTGQPRLAKPLLMSLLVAM